MENLRTEIGADLSPAPISITELTNLLKVASRLLVTCRSTPRAHNPTQIDLDSFLAQQPGYGVRLAYQPAHEPTPTYQLPLSPRVSITLDNRSAPFCQLISTPRSAASPSPSSMALMMDSCSPTERLS